ncbi:MAG: NAD(P)-dependent oxidoreductase [Microgenomates group bacterium]|nr:NAD(P)-dependent oxidoreductase [Microgenomates group bacterium]
MKIYFFEVASWEKELLQKNFPEAVLVEEKLTIENVRNFSEAQIVSTFVYSQLTKEVVDSLPNLKFIATRSTGFDHINVEYCKQRGILVANVPEYGSRTVAEHTFALILTLTRKIYQSINQAKNFDFNHENIRGVDIFGKTLGVIGAGKIGIEVIKIAKGFGMKILVFNRSQKQELAKELGFEYVDLQTLFKNSDIVSLHLPYNKNTHHIINKENIEFFKKGSFLINTARGGLVETEALVLGLEKGILSGVALDVLEGEKEIMDEIEVMTSSYKKDIDLKTLILNHVLVNHPKVIITPHNAFNTKEALERITKTTIENIKAFLNNKPQNLV